MSTEASDKRLLHVKAIAEDCIMLLHTTSYTCSKVVLRHKMKGMKSFVNTLRWLIRTNIHIITRFVSSMLDLIGCKLPPDAFAKAIDDLKLQAQLLSGDVGLIRSNVQRLRVYYEEPGMDEEEKKVGMASVEAVEVCFHGVGG